MVTGSCFAQLDVSDSVAKLLDTAGIAARVDVLNELAYDSSRANTTLALICADSALRLSRKHGFRAREASALLRKQKIYKDRSEFAIATAYADSTIEIRKALGDTEGVVGVLVAYGIIARRVAAYDVAMDRLLEARELIAEKDAPDTKRRLGIALGQLYQLIDSLDLAEQEFRKVLRTLPDGVIDYQTHVGIASVYLGQEQWDSAYKHYNIALEIVRSENKRRSEANILFNLGELFILQDKGKQGIAYLTSAHQIFKDQKNVFGIIDVQINLGQLFLNEDQWEKAEQHLLQADELTRGSSNDLLIQQEAIYTNLQEIYASTGRWKKAHVMLQQLRVVEDQMLSEKAVANIQASQIEHQVYQKNLALARAKRKEAEDESQKRSLVFALLAAAGVIALLIVALLLYRTRIKNREANTLIEIQEREQTRIGRDLHDNVGAKLSTLKYRMEELTDEQYRERMDQKLSQVIGLLDETVDEVRSISHNMVSGVLVRYGLVPALKDLVASIRVKKGPQVRVLAFGVPEELGETEELYVYRIVQELIINVVKHAEATEASVRLEKKGQELHLTVQDNGKGIHPENDLAGIGQANVRNRVQHLGGTVSWDSENGKGTQVNIRIPLK